jgi:mannose-6-phosphate isomerase-like protein (cupin superfamily)
MQTKSIDTSLVNHRGGQTSHLLLGRGDFASRQLAITWVDCPPGSCQPVHRHDGLEQVYVITRGRGRMTVGAEEQDVSEGMLVFVPPATDHAIRNDGVESLIYVSATSPPFEDIGPDFSWVPQKSRHASSVPVQHSRRSS